MQKEKVMVGIINRFWFSSFMILLGHQKSFRMQHDLALCIKPAMKKVEVIILQDSYLISIHLPTDSLYPAYGILRMGGLRLQRILIQMNSLITFKL